MTRSRHARTVHLSFSGGEARGYAHIGCLQAVERLGLRVTEVSGSSIGALVAALYAADFTAAEIERVGTSLPRRQFLRYNWPEARALVNLFRRKPHRKPAGVWSLEPYYRTVNRLLGRARFKDLKRPCAIQATDLTNLRPVIFSRDVDPYMEVAFAVKASSAVPGLMSPVEWGGLVLADGGAFVDLDRLSIRAPRIVVSNVSSHGYERQAITSLPRVIAAYLRYRERAWLPPRSVRGVPVTVIRYPAALGRLRPFRRPKPEVARQIITEARWAALQTLAARGPARG
ncbi:MAG: patatin-like phospholipase family protein [Candidatus Rokubacteria bacterium]|nr:patatin-like phospholipase family protein [Candidatus Rokubacteria bacterium]